MLTKVEIKNYRLFDHLVVSDLAPITLIAGKNNTGKSSLLEAIFFAALGNQPTSGSNSNVTRLHIDPDGDSAHGLLTYWRRLFRDSDESQPLEVVLYDDSDGEHAMRASIEPQPHSDETDINRGVSEAPSISTEEVGLMIRHKSADGREGYVWSTDVEDNQVRAIASSEYVKPARAYQILKTNVDNSKEMMDAFRQRRIQRETDSLLSALRIIEPRLQGLEESAASGAAAIWGDLEGVFQLMPLGLMGEGLIRLARIVLAISRVEGGVVLVDEIESGLHHSVLGEIWQAIDYAAKENGTQIIATTHSYECIEAAKDAIDPERLRLTRLDVIDDCVRPVSFRPEQLETALVENWEIR